MNKKIYLLFGLLVILYILINFATPTNPTVLARYQMNAFQYQLMRAAITVPLIFVWFAAFYGFSKLIQYARLIRKSKDGEGFLWIAAGITVLGIGLPVNAISMTALSRAVSSGLITQPVSTIVSTHLTVGYQLVGFILIALGSWNLLKVLKKVQFPLGNIIASGSILAVISLFYIVIALNDPSREVAVAPAQTANFYMNDALIFLTIIVPYIILWLCGFFSFIAIRAYQHHVGGVLYKKALKKLNTGLLIIIMMSVILQFVTAAITTIYAWQIGPYVAFTQLFVLAIGFGFVYVALGAKGLAKLERLE